jgi:hypothetical protein
MATPSQFLVARMKLLHPKEPLVLEHLFRVDGNYVAAASEFEQCLGYTRK